MIIYSVTDRIPVTIGEVSFLISPLTWRQRGELLALTQLEGGAEKVDRYEFAAKCLKFSVKGVSGLRGPDGSEYRAEMDANGCLSDDCVSDLMSLDGAAELVRVCSANLTGLRPGVQIPGVSFDFDRVTSIKKKPAEDRQG